MAQFLSLKLVPLIGGVMAAIIMTAAGGVAFYGMLQEKIAVVVGLGLLLRAGTEIKLQETAQFDFDRSKTKTIVFSSLKFSSLLLAFLGSLVYLSGHLNLEIIVFLCAIPPFNLVIICAATLKGQGTGYLSPLFESGAIMFLTCIFYSLHLFINAESEANLVEVAICYLIASSVIALAGLHKILTIGRDSCDPPSQSSALSPDSGGANFALNISQYLLQWSPILCFGMAGESRLSGLFSICQRAMLVFHVFLQAEGAVKTRDIVFYGSHRNYGNVSKILWRSSIKLTQITVAILSSLAVLCLGFIFAAEINVDDDLMFVAAVVLAAQVVTMRGGLIPLGVIFSHRKRVYAVQNSIICGVALFLMIILSATSDGRGVVVLYLLQITCFHAFTKKQMRSVVTDHDGSDAIQFHPSLIDALKVARTKT